VSASAQVVLDSVERQADHPHVGVMVAARASLVAVSVCVAALSSVPIAAQPLAQPTGERVRVPARHANIHMGPNTTTEVLVLAPRDTVLTVLARDKEWVQVRLTPELRKTGIVMRWYKNEDRGWMHDSTVTASAARD
jgi:hypothetical protein